MERGHPPSTSPCDVTYGALLGKLQDTFFPSTPSLFESVEFVEQSMGVLRGTRHFKGVLRYSSKRWVRPIRELADTKLMDDHKTRLVPSKQGAVAGIFGARYRYLLREC